VRFQAILNATDIGGVPSDDGDDDDNDVDERRSWRRRWRWQECMRKRRREVEKWKKGEVRWYGSCGDYTVREYDSRYTDSVRFAVCRKNVEGNSAKKATRQRGRNGAKSRSIR
jgi:hypothetical protein